MSDAEKFEDLKKRIDSLKVKKIAAETESRRLSEELEKIKSEIKEKYNVEIADFAEAIESMKQEQERKMRKLEELVSEAEDKLEK